MIQSVVIDNLTVFDRVAFTPSPGLNVIIGENGTGKTHLLKALYSIAATLAPPPALAAAPPTRAGLQSALAQKLTAVFRPESLGRLARRKQGRARCTMEIVFAPDRRIAFGFATNSKTEVQLQVWPDAWVEAPSAYLPTRELLTIYPNFVSIYDSHFLEFEETWRDTCVLLGAPLARGPREGRIERLLEPVARAMGGSVELDRNGRFYLSTAAGRMEMPLVAEGLRKLAMLARLIATGKLLDNGHLFWDEPEANLNPALIKTVARLIADLAQAGVQVFVATHSLFLLRELELMRLDGDVTAVPMTFLGLERRDEEHVVAVQADELAGIAQIAALDEELAQADRFFAVP